jgi:hypothetical protein
VLDATAICSKSLTTVEEGICIPTEDRSSSSDSSDSIRKNYEEIFYDRDIKLKGNNALSCEKRSRLMFSSHIEIIPKPLSSSSLLFLSDCQQQHQQQQLSPKSCNTCTNNDTMKGSGSLCNAKTLPVSMVPVLQKNDDGFTSFTLWQNDDSHNFLTVEESCPSSNASSITTTTIAKRSKNSKKHHSNNSFDSLNTTCASTLAQRLMKTCISKASGLVGIQPKALSSMPQGLRKRNIIDDVTIMTIFVGFETAIFAPRNSL